MKKVGESIAILIYGPYSNKAGQLTWMVRLPGKKSLVQFQSKMKMFDFIDRNSNKISTKKPPK